MCMCVLGVCVGTCTRMWGWGCAGRPASTLRCFIFVEAGKQGNGKVTGGAIAGQAETEPARASQLSSAARCKGRTW